MPGEGLRYPGLFRPRPRLPTRMVDRRDERGQPVGEPVPAYRYESDSAARARAFEADGAWPPGMTSEEFRTPARSGPAARPAWSVSGSEIRASHPSLRDRIGQAVYEAADALGLPAQSMRENTEFAVDFVPVVGDTVAAQEAYQAFADGNYFDAVLAAGGLIPIVGDVARKGGRLAMGEAAQLGRAGEAEIRPRLSLGHGASAAAEAAPEAWMPPAGLAGDIAGGGLGWAARASAPARAARIVQELQRASAEQELARMNAARAPWADLEEGESLASRSSQMYDLPEIPQRPLSADYRFGEPPVEPGTGRLTHDRKGRLLRAAFTIGRTMEAGSDTGFSPASLVEIAKRRTGREPQARSGGSMRGQVGEYAKWRDSDQPDGYGREIRYRDGLTGDDLNRVIGHEIAHSIIDAAGPGTTYIRTGRGHAIPFGAFPEVGPRTDLGKQLRQSYHAQNDPSWRRLKAPKPKLLFGPEHKGYQGTEISEELWTEAIRGYGSVPNTFKEWYPKVAEAIQDFVNDHPDLRDLIQFNSLIGAGGLGLMALGLRPDEAEADELTGAPGTPPSLGPTDGRGAPAEGAHFPPRLYEPQGTDAMGGVTGMTGLVPGGPPGVEQPGRELQRVLAENMLDPRYRAEPAQDGTEELRRVLAENMLDARRRGEPALMGVGELQRVLAEQEMVRWERAQASWQGGRRGAIVPYGGRNDRAWG